MTHRIPGGGHLVNLRAYSGPGSLAELVFGAPLVQAFPGTAVGFASAAANPAATPSYIWQCDEPSSSLVDEIASEPLVPFMAPLQAQTAVGLGSTRTNRSALEMVFNSGARHGSASFMDQTTGSFAILVGYRSLADTGGASALIGKRNASGFGIYMYSGGIASSIKDATTGKDASLAGEVKDGANRVACLVVNRTTNLLWIITEEGSSSIDISTIGSLTSTETFGIGSMPSWALSHAHTQVTYAVALEGAAAEAMDAATVASFWKHATDPTTGQLLTAHTRGSAVACPVADGYVAHYAPDTIATGWHAGFSDTGKLGALSNSGITNLLLWSEDFTNAAWVKSSTTAAANDADSPDGFRGADRLTASAGNGYVSQVFATSTSTEYTLNLWLREYDVGCTGRLIFYDEIGPGELASQAFICDGTWEQRISVTATTTGAQVSSSFRVEIDTTGEALPPVSP